MEGSCKYIELVADSRQRTVLKTEGWAEGQELLTIKYQHVTKRNTKPQFKIGTSGRI